MYIVQVHARPFYDHNKYVTFQSVHNKFIKYFIKCFALLHCRMINKAEVRVTLKGPYHEHFEYTQLYYIRV
jgi:hypothetical protein